MNWVHFSRGAIQLAELLKRADPEIPVVLGGQHAGLFASEVLERHNDVVDAVLVGEAERSLLAVCQGLLETGQVPSDVPGVFTLDRHDGEVRTPEPSVVEDLDELPIYSYGTLQKRKGDAAAGPVSTARGACPLRCAYCVEHVVGRMQGRRGMAFASPERVADQICALVSEGIRRITIQDGFFLRGDELAVGVAEVLRDRCVRLDHINVFAHPGCIGQEGLLALRAIARVASIDFGVETGSGRVARRIGRPTDRGVIVGAVRQAFEMGVTPRIGRISGRSRSDNPQSDNSPGEFGLARP